MAANVHVSHRVTVSGSMFVKILPRYSQSEIQATKKKKKKTTGIQQSKKSNFIFKRFMQPSLSFVKEAALTGSHCWKHSLGSLLYVGLCWKMLSEPPVN